MLGREHVVRCDAGLSGVEELAGEQARRDRRDIGVGMNQRGRFSAELERDRRELLGRGAGDLAPHGGRTGEKKMIEGQP